MQQQRVTLGAVFVVLGIVFLIGQRMGVGGEGVVATVGVALLVAYAFTRHYGFLVPGGIVTGLGLGIIYQTRMHAEGAPVLLGLGLGFVSIYPIDSSRRGTPRGWWPLIPGGILIAIGLLQVAGGTGILGTIGRWWPLVLIAVGVYLLLRRRSGSPGT